MARYFIESVKCGVGEGGMACGPVSGPIVAEAKVRTDNGDEFYMSLAEVEGIPNFFKSPRSTYELQVEEEMDDEELEEFQSYFVETGDYAEIFEDPDPEWFQLYRYLIYIVRADWDDCEKFQEETAGKWLDEIDVPASDLEEDYLEECEDEEDFELPEIK